VQAAMEIDEKIQYVIEHTKVVKPPKQSLATFGSTNVYYYLISELIENVNVIREGRVIAAKPKIVTPTYLINLEGFSGEARRFIEMMAERFPHEAGVYYSYKNEPKEMNIVSEPAEQIVTKISRTIDDAGDPLKAIIQGVDEMWDVSLMKFTYELTRESLNSNVAEFERRGLLNVDNEGIPKAARNHIEELFIKVKNDPSLASKLIIELKRWGLFQEYQDRFLNLFRK
jgi:hypothetical protein